MAMHAESHRLFQALTVAEYVEMWARPAHGAEAKCEINARVHGDFSVRVCAPGREICSVSGRFLEVQLFQRLVFTWNHSAFPGATESQVSILLTPMEDGTDLTLKHSGLASGSQQATTDLLWKRSIARLAELLDHKGARSEIDRRPRIFNGHESRN